MILNTRFIEEGTMLAHKVDSTLVGVVCENDGSCIRIRWRSDLGNRTWYTTWTGTFSDNPWYIYLPSPVMRLLYED